MQTVPTRSGPPSESYPSGAVTAADKQQISLITPCGVTLDQPSRSKSGRRHGVGVTDYVGKGFGRILWHESVWSKKKDVHAHASAVHVQTS